MCFRWTVKIKKGGGISFNAVVKLTHMNEKLVDLILREYSELFKFEPTPLGC